MPELNISRIQIPNGNYLNIKDPQAPDVNEAIEAILDGGGSEIFAQLYVDVEEGAVVSAVSAQKTYTATAGSGDEAFIEIGKPGTYTLGATKNGCLSSTTTITINASGGVYNEELNFIRLTVSIPNGSTYTITKGATTISGTSAGVEITHYLPSTGTWTVSCTDGTESSEGTVVVSDYTDYYIALAYV